MIKSFFNTFCNYYINIKYTIVLKKSIEKSEKNKKLSVESVPPEIRVPSHVNADTGYFSEKAVIEVENDGMGPTVYCAVEKHGHHRSVEDLLKKDDPPPAPDDASVKEKMAARLKTAEGRAKYKARKETVEPVFGIIKSVMRFRQFSLRGLAKVNLEWDLVTLAYNLKRLHKLAAGKLAYSDAGKKIAIA